jgi:hypothetical protein
VIDEESVYNVDEIRVADALEERTMVLDSIPGSGEPVVVVGQFESVVTDSKLTEAVELAVGVLVQRCERSTGRSSPAFVDRLRCLEGVVPPRDVVMVADADDLRSGDRRVLQRTRVLALRRPHGPESGCRLSAPLDVRRFHPRKRGTTARRVVRGRS